MSIKNLPATFDGLDLSIVVIGDERWIGGAQIGHGLGYIMGSHAIGKIYKRNQKEFSIDDTMVVELPSSGGPQLTRLYSAKGIAKIAMFANTPKAAAFRDWAASVLTTPIEAPPVALPAPALSRSAVIELRKAWLRTDKDRKFVRYQKLGLSNTEICLLCGFKNPATISKMRRTAEALGLIDTQPDPKQVARMAQMRAKLGERRAQERIANG